MKAGVASREEHLEDEGLERPRVTRLAAGGERLGGEVRTVVEAR